MDTVQLEEEIDRVLSLLDKLTVHKPPLQPLGALNPKLLASCRAVFFYHTSKIGLGVGVKWGKGLLVAKCASNGSKAASWSNPVVYKVSEGSVGLTAGYGTSETMLLLGASTALDKFRRSSKIVAGTDFKVVAITDLGLGSAEDAGAMAASGDAVAISLADGLMVDWSVVGGTISFNSSANSELYGPEATTDTLLDHPAEGTAGTGAASGSAASIARLHEALNEISAAAAQDPRSFTGFTKRWKPQNVFQDEHTMHQGVDAHKAAPVASHVKHA